MPDCVLTGVSYALEERVPDKIPCSLCGRVGLVRLEVMVKGHETSLTYWCGYCQHSWQQADRRIVERAEAGHHRKETSPD